MYLPEEGQTSLHKGKFATVTEGYCLNQLLQENATKARVKSIIKIITFCF